MAKVICEICGKEISPNNIKKHLQSHESHPEYHVSKMQHVNHEGLNCIYCGKLYKNKNSLAQHECRCAKNHNRVKTNKGKILGKCLTKQNVSIEHRCCPFCGKTWLVRLSSFTNHINHCKLNPQHKSFNHNLSEQGRINIGLASKARGAGGYEVGKLGGRGKRGYYKGYYCMSSWELAWLVYQLEQGQKVEQCREHFKYFYNNSVHNYTPDFKIDGVYYEIKNWHRPDTDAKINSFPKDKKLVLIEGEKAIQPYLNYVEEKYGKNFTELLYE